jgi:arylsulfatase A-like enzyme
VKVLLVVIDTLRADHLGCYGYHRKTSPRIDAVTEQGVLFERAYASDVPTQPSYTAMFTGQRGIRTGVVSHSDTENLPDSTPYLSDILAANGYATGAVSTLFMMKKYFARGFNAYMNPVAGNRARLQQIDADEVNAAAIPWLKANRDRDFFLFLHYWDPHSLYKPPAKYRRLFYKKGNPCDPKNRSLAALDQQIVGPFVRGHLDRIRQNLTDAEYVIAQYDGEIRYVDDTLGQVLDLLADLGIGEETLLIITSDHGESMTEHNIFFDHCDVYEVTIRVPLIIRWPERFRGGRRIRGLVQGIDIPATILDAARIASPEASQGRSLLPLARGQADRGYREIFSNQGLWQAKRTMSDGRWKFIKALDNGYWPAPPRELYDLQDDTGENSNLIEKQPEIARDMELRLTRWEESQLGNRIDPLRKIASIGLPSRPWVEAAAVRKGMKISWEEFRAVIDIGTRGEATE